MTTRTLYNIYKTTLMILCGMTVLSCTDTFVEEQEQNGTSGNGNGTGELVLFTAGRTNNTVSTRADGDGGSGSGGNDGNSSNYSETPGETYYMGHSSRFVCRMYYIADNASETEFDLTDNTKTVSWFVVDGNAGNSLYWNKNYNNVVLSPNDKSDQSQYDTYGNDKTATFFYWQNRKPHAFLAWTDLNKAKNDGFKYGETPGTLKMTKDDTYEEHTGVTRKQFLFTGYKVVGVNGVVNTSLNDILDYAINNYSTISTSDAQTSVDKPEITDYNSAYTTGRNNIRYSYIGSSVQRYNEVKDDQEHLVQYDFGHYIYYVWSEDQRLDYTFTDGDVVDTNPDSDGKYWVKNGNVKVAQRGDAYLAPSGYTAQGEPYDYTDGDGTVWKYHFWAVRYLNFLYDLSQTPAYIVALDWHYEEKESEVINEFEVLKFDLTHKTGDGKNSIADQPDPCQALTIMKPAGATQAANRVNLYFKHQFSQVQVNLKSSSDNSVSISKDQIKMVELLGVSEEGYVFNELYKKEVTDPETGTPKEVFDVHPATYKDVDITDYNEHQLALNPYGTSLELFDMGAGNYEFGYLKSFNGITFGLLKAIRITWEETTENGGLIHTATFKVTDTNLNTLKSGRKYIWNIELRRGTLAVITTTINDWIVPTDISENGSNNLNYTTDGTIHN